MHTLVMAALGGCGGSNGATPDGGPNGPTGGATGLNGTGGADGSASGGDGGVDAGEGSMDGGDAGATGSAPTDAGDAALPDVPLTPYERCAQYVQEYCALREGCGYNLGGCLNDARYCPDLFFAEGSTLDESSLAQCEGTLATTSCADVARAAPEACAPGTITNGEACTFDSQCESLLCVGGPSACGTCEARTPEGEACGAGAPAPCDPGLFCVETCVADRPTDGAGMGVRLGVTGEDCVNDADCLPHLRCGGDAEGNDGTCTAPAPVGQPCILGTETRRACNPMCDPQQGGICASGAYCDLAATAGAPPVCAPSPGLGELCVEGAFGARACSPSGFCREQADGAFRCVAAAQGDDCGFLSAISGSCGSQMHCTSAFQNGTCQPRNSLGDVCSTLILGQPSCEEDLSCVLDEVTMTNICIDPAGEGDACDALHPCVTALECTNGICEQIPDGYFGTTCAPAP